jgi:GH15 family glucan-1,4-alpha-glucosidase
MITMDQERAYPPIDDYGLIGNCFTAALINSRGSLDWLCMPCFDSSSVFASILDIERGGSWSIHPTASCRSEHRYLEYTNVLETIFVCDEGRVRLLDFMPVSSEAAGGTVYPPIAVIRIIEVLDGEVEIESLCQPRPDYGLSFPTFEAQGTRVAFDRYTITGPSEWRIDETGGSVSCRLTVRPGERLAFILSHEEDGRFPSAQIEDPHDLLRETIDFWRTWSVGSCTYRGPYYGSVIRSALTLKLLNFAPTGAIVAAPTTSLPEEIGGERNWDYRFTWIRDASFTLYALLLAGYIGEDRAFFEWIVRTVEVEETGIKILYPISPEGQVTEKTLDHLEGYRGSRPVRIGNEAVDQVQLDVYGEVLDALHFACKAGGYDPAPLWDDFRPLIEWIAENWNQPGNGIWEVRGGLRDFVYGKVLAWVALDRGIKLAKAKGLAGDTDHWRRERDRIRADVLEKGWSKRLGAFKQSYQDERLDAANLLLPIVGFIDGDDPRMLSTLDATLDQLVVDGLCYRYLDAPEGLSGEEGAFVLCTFWLIDALILAGREQEAQGLFERTLERATPLGLFAEEIEPATGAHLGNFPQAFSHIGVINAAVSLARSGQEGTIVPEHVEPTDAVGAGGARRSDEESPRRNY